MLENQILIAMRHSGAYQLASICSNTTRLASIVPINYLCVSYLHFAKTVSATQKATNYYCYYIGVAVMAHRYNHRHCHTAVMPLMFATTPLCLCFVRTWSIRRRNSRTRRIKMPSSRIILLLRNSGDWLCGGWVH